MNSILERLRIPVSVIELVIWLPASCMGLTLTAAYVVAGNEPPASVMAGFFLVPITFLAGPIYALTGHARTRPRCTVVALALPLLSLALTWVSDLPSLTHGHL
jgi:hypothetical protein